jgi:hypothetical protein
MSQETRAELKSALPDTINAPEIIVLQEKETALVGLAQMRGVNI